MTYTCILGGTQILDQRFHKRSISHLVTIPHSYWPDAVDLARSFRKPLPSKFITISSPLRQGGRVNRICFPSGESLGLSIGTGDSSISSLLAPLISIRQRFRSHFPGLHVVNLQFCMRHVAHGKKPIDKANRHRRICNTSRFCVSYLFSLLRAFGSPVGGISESQYFTGQPV